MPDATFRGRKTLQPFEQVKKVLKRMHLGEPKANAATLKGVFKPIFERQGVFSFQSLPPEIRNRIYEYVFVKPTNIGLRSGRPMSQCRNHPTKIGRTCVCFYLEATRWRNLSFASTCRFIHYESFEMFFAKNGFTFYAIGPALHFLMAIGPRCRGLITKLEFYLPTYAEGIFDAFRYLKSCTSLRELHISCDDAGIAVIDELWEVSIRDPIQYFLGNSNKLRLTVTIFDSAIFGLEPDDWTIARLYSFADEFLLIKREESGEYEPFCAPNVFTHEMYLRPKGFLRPSRTARKEFSNMRSWVESEWRLAANGKA